MDKKQVKEMANICEIYHSCALCPYNPEDITRFIGERWKGGCPDYDRKLVYAMGKGYRKINKNEAVISRRKYKNLKKELKEMKKQRDEQAYITEDLIQEKHLWTEQVRKETAEKIFKLIDKKLDLYKHGVIGGNLYDAGYKSAVEEIKQSISKQFGVEIGEDV